MVFTIYNLSKLFFRKNLSFSGAMTKRWNPQTCYTLRRNTASVKKISWDCVSQKNFYYKTI